MRGGLARAPREGTPDLRKASAASSPTSAESARASSAAASAEFPRKLVAAPPRGGGNGEGKREPRKKLHSRSLLQAREPVSVGGEGGV